MLAARGKERRTQLADMVAWWMQRMQQTPNPLREKLTLFWHGHFATGAEKVRNVYYMWLQNETLRQHALGNFGAMVKAILRDPAMLIWLDTDQSLAFKPNENFARELMELFTLGIGHYTETDVQQGARAFTGYKVNPASQSFRYAPLQHDDGEKTFLGKKGRFDGDAAIDIILAQPACAPFIARKLWTFFAYENPQAGPVDALAGTLVSHHYELRPALRRMFLSEEFYSRRAIRMQIKSPVQWIVGSSKVLETPLPATRPLLSTLHDLGQVPFMPPNVKGWDGGKSWITTSTLLARYNLASFLTGKGPVQVQPLKQGNAAAKRPPREVLPASSPRFAHFAPEEIRKDPQALVARLTLRLFQSPLSAKETEPFVEFLQDKPKPVNDKTIADLIQLMMSTPQYQLI